MEIWNPCLTIEGAKFIIEFSIMQQRLWMDLESDSIYCITNFSWN